MSDEPQCRVHAENAENLTQRSRRIDRPEYSEFKLTHYRPFTSFLSLCPNAKRRCRRLNFDILRLRSQPFPSERRDLPVREILLRNLAGIHMLRASRLPIR